MRRKSLRNAVCGLAAILLLQGTGHGQPISYPDLAVRGPLPLVEKPLEPDPEDIVTTTIPKTVDLLIEVLDEKDSAVRSRAAWALGDIGDPKAITFLKKLLKDPVSQVRGTAVCSLAKIGTEEAVAGILEAARDEDVQVRRETIRALGEVGSEYAVGALIESFDDPDYQCCGSCFFL